jgi:glycosyltransferase involved in cell wall biosynthesis
MLRIGVIMYQTSLTKGQELVAQRMVKEFRRQGYDAFLITSIFHDWEQVISTDELSKRGGYIHLFDELLGIPVVRVSSESTGWPPRRIAFTDFINILTRVVDELKLNVLITHSTLWNGPEEALKFVEWRRNLVKGGSLHGQQIFCHMSHFQEPSDERYAIYERSYRETWNDLSLSQIAKKADLILVTTPFEKEWMKRVGASDEKCFLFPGGIEDNLQDSLIDSNNFKNKYGLPRNAKLVSFLGTIEERKNVFAILEVAKLLSRRSDVHFVIAGRLEGEYGDKVKQEAMNLSNVSLLGMISSEEKAALIKCSFINITMSRAEALGLAQMEFMSAGVPVISSGIGGQSWIVKNGVNGIILNGPDDVKGASNAIIRLIDNLSFRNKLSKNTMSLASRYFISSLTYQLSKRLEDLVQRTSDVNQVRLGVPLEEHTIEAWVSKRLRVVATNRRLVIGSIMNGKGAVSVHYNEMKKIVYHVRTYWFVPLIGLGITMSMLMTRILYPSFSILLKKSMELMVASLGFENFTASFVIALPFIPLIASSLIFLSSFKRGYLMIYGVSEKIFLPREFQKALQLADRLTPQNLFADNDKIEDELVPESNISIK